MTSSVTSRAEVRSPREWAGCPHLLVYSGYANETLQRMAERQPAIGAVLDAIKVLVDGPCVAALAHSAGPWTPSGNRQVIDLVATRGVGGVVCLAQASDDGWERAA